MQFLVRDGAQSGGSSCGLPLFGLDHGHEHVFHRRLDRSRRGTAMPRALPARCADAAVSPLASSSTVTCRPPPNTATSCTPGTPFERAHGFQHVGGIQLQQGVRSQGLLQLRRRAQRDHLAAIHQRQAVAVFGFVHVVRADENGVAGCGKLVDQIPEARRARWGPRPEVGSSRNSTGGSCRMAQPSASRCFQPPESVLRQARRRSSRSAISST